MKPLLALASVFAFLGGQAVAEIGETATASFIDQDGEPTGAATLTQTNAGVLIDLDVLNLPPESWIAFHIHEGGVCDPEHDHDSAGEHFSPSGADHGFLTEGGPHEGDMPNQYVAADGVLRAHVLNAMVSLDGGETGIRGRTLILHEGADDYASQPSGDAGDPVACAVIE
ncbi:superoxide dismutase family protein [Roseinatronobacter sp. S2]|uniref:superoxide dismutase family protein n=1 Tax=Roseinatronobacter sp. S2 TaxID=3035471 RepID=UPI00241036DE|nr:superoxide dismutase family protein [Roseinatronobacter sp. S2]WFE76560.1 superoxide dismutase family protein [Roseinatronobacter sp. S2]